MNHWSSRAVLRFACSVAVIALTSSGGAAFAQAANEDEAEAKEIVVIGITKQDAKIQETPSAITAFSGDQLVEQGVREVREVAKFTPGFTIREAGNNPTAFALAIRGQVQNDNIATLEPSVGVYLDEFYISRAYGMNTNLLDISSAQVLKGPQGTLFGRNTSAGAVLLQTNDPKFGETSAQLATTYGRFDERSGTAIVNFGSDNVALRGAIFYEKRDGYQHDAISGRTYGERRTINGRVKMGFKPADNVTLLLSGEWWDGKLVGQARQNVYFNLGGTGFDPGAADRARYGGNPDIVTITNPALIPGTPSQGLFNDMKTQTYLFKVKVDTGIGEIKWINGYREIKGNNLLDLDGASSPAFYHFTQGIQDLKEYSSELQLTGQAFADRLSYAVGFTFLKESGSDESHSNAPNPPPGPSAVWTRFKGTIDNKSLGFYGQANYKLTDQLSLTGGLRWSHDDKGVTAQSSVIPLNRDPIAACLPVAFTRDNNGDGVLSAADCDRSRADKWSNLSYTFGVDYKVSDDVLLYAKQSRGYRAGAQQLRTLTLNDTAPAEPEIVNEQELGLKTEFLDRRVRFNVAAYHTTVKGAQRSVILNVGGTSQTILENASTKNWGAEADLSVRVADGLDLFASGSVTDPKYTRYNGFVVVSGVLTPFDKSGYKFASIVKKQFALGANLNRDLGFGRLKANVSYAWQGKMYQVAEPISVLTTPSASGGGGLPNATEAQKLINAGTTNSYGITNARLAVAFGPEDQYEVAVWGRNVFDVRAKQYILFLGGFNYVGTSWNDPATYGVTLTAKF